MCEQHVIDAREWRLASQQVERGGRSIASAGTPLANREQLMLACTHRAPRSHTRALGASRPMLARCASVAAVWTSESCFECRHVRGNCLQLTRALFVRRASA